MRFAATSYYHPYDTSWREEIGKIAESMRDGNLKSAEDALVKLIDREHSMRMDGHAVAIALYEKMGDSEKARKHKDYLEGLSGTVFAPDRGTSFEKPIEVLFIDEEYTVLRAMKLKIKSQALSEHGGHRFDVLTTQAGQGGPERALLFQHRHALAFSRSQLGQGVREVQKTRAPEEIARVMSCKLNCRAAHRAVMVAAPCMARRPAAAYCSRAVERFDPRSPSPSDRTRIEPRLETEPRADGTDGTRCPAQLEPLPQPENRFNSRAMGAQEVLQPHRPELLSRPVERGRVGLEKVEAAQGGVHPALANFLPGVLERVNDSGVPAAGDDHQALVAVDDERHVLGDVVLDHRAVVFSDHALHAPVSFRVRARDRPGQPDPGQNLCRPIDHDKRAAKLFILLPELKCLVGLV